MLLTKLANDVAAVVANPARCCTAVPADDGSLMTHQAANAIRAHLAR